MMLASILWGVVAQWWSWCLASQVQIQSSHHVWNLGKSFTHSCL